MSLRQKLLLEWLIKNPIGISSNRIVFELQDKIIIFIISSSYYYCYVRDILSKSCSTLYV